MLLKVYWDISTVTERYNRIEEDHSRSVSYSYVVYSDSALTIVVGNMITFSTFAPFVDKSAIVNISEFNLNIESSLYTFKIMHTIPFQYPTPSAVRFPNSFKFKTKCNKINGIKLSKKKVELKVSATGQRSIIIFKI